MRKFERIGMVVLRSTTLCVAVSSFTSSWRLTVISIAAPCATDCSTVSTIDTAHPPPSERSQPGNPAHLVLATLYNSLRRYGKRPDWIPLDCIHLANKRLKWKSGQF